MSKSRPIHDLEALAKDMASSDWALRTKLLRQIASKIAREDIGSELELRLFERLLDATHAEKWEVRKAAIQVLGEMRHIPVTRIAGVLAGLRSDPNRWVRQVAAHAHRHLSKRGQPKSEWALAGPVEDPNLQYIMERIREIGLRSMTPANIYKLSMETVDRAYRELAADTAHEVRTILTPLHGFTTELDKHFQREGAHDARSRRIVHGIQEAVTDLRRLIDNLHTYGSPPAEQCQRVNLSELIKKSINIIYDVYINSEAIINVGLDVPPDIFVDAFPHRLLQALTNIVANAFQAMPSGGQLTVRSLKPDASTINIRICDTGHGMTPENAELAFRRFHTTRRDSGGTGLGLPIAWQVIVEEHCGDLLIESAVGKGTHVIIRLPAHHEEK